MKVSVIVVVLVIGLAHTAFAQEAGNGGPKVYSSPELRIEFVVAPNWELKRLGDEGLALSSMGSKWNVDDEALPAPDHPWFVVVKPEGGDCSLDDRSVPPFTFASKKSEVRVCKAGLAVLLGYWESDKNHNQHVAEMLDMLGSIRPLRAR